MAETVLDQCVSLASKTRRNLVCQNQNFQRAFWGGMHGILAIHADLTGNPSGYVLAPDECDAAPGHTWFPAFAAPLQLTTWSAPRRQHLW